MYKFGTIVLIPFPFTDLTSTRLRPALIISKNNNLNDVILAFISTKVNIYSENTILINKDNSYYKTSGLKNPSVIRLDKIATLDKKLILGELGSLPDSFLKSHKNEFLNIFGF